MAGLPARFVSLLRRLPRLAVAFSGGLDSRFLCHAALLCGCDVLAIHARGPHIPQAETSLAQAWAQDRGLALMTLEYSPLIWPEVARMDKQRCYACKRGLVSLVRKALSDNGDAKNRILCDGTNADDLKSYRPGLRALTEGGVRSPLAEVGLAKSDVREAARKSGLDQPEQRARPCLLTRFSYGVAPDVTLLQRLDAAETALAALSVNGHEALGDFRLRLTPAPLLHARCLPKELLGRIKQLLEQFGFSHCICVETAHVSGFFDRSRADGMVSDGR
ncbi:MAG: ATP-dependent sacrificial sulfur transferase LarE [Desulfovibrio sp.]|nr:ATP-dependent sacrificial sulfur transferase LarE [Desulfovibrio sp.]